MESETAPAITTLADAFTTALPESDSVDADDPDALDEWFTQCADALIPYFEPTEDHRGWMTDADLKVFVVMDTREWWEPVTEERTVTDSTVTRDGLETSEQTEEVTVDRVREGEVVGHYLDVQADTETERRAVDALAHALNLTVSEYQGTHTRFTHQLTHPDYEPQP